MTRKEGFIEVDKMLEKIGVDTTDLDTILASPLVHIIKNNTTGIHFSFKYEGETYFYKHSFYIKNGLKIVINPYNELVAQELTKDFDISCIDYDLAILNSNRGVLSKSYKQENIIYISGAELLQEFVNNAHGRRYNTLENIWDALEYHYQNYPNKRDTIRNLMKQVVNIYLYDIITCQIDRHPKNWEIMEEDDNVNIAPLYDNSMILESKEENAVVSLGVDFIWADYESLWKSIKQFQRVSSEEFTNIIKEKLWIISGENLNKVFDRTEKKTGYRMPDEEKKFYLNSYRKHKEKLEEILGLTEEREEHNERKNR